MWRKSVPRACLSHPGTPTPHFSFSPIPPFKRANRTLKIRDFFFFKNDACSKDCPWFTVNPGSPQGIPQRKLKLPGQNCYQRSSEGHPQKSSDPSTQELRQEVQAALVPLNLVRDQVGTLRARKAVPVHQGPRTGLQSPLGTRNSPLTCDAVSMREGLGLSQAMVGQVGRADRSLTRWGLGGERRGRGVSGP